MMNKTDLNKNIIRNEILIPEKVEDIHSIVVNIRPKPKYIGPGYWYKILRKLIKSSY